MPLFKIGRYETFCTTYLVEADTAAEAVSQCLLGKGHFHGERTYIGGNEEHGITYDEDPELLEQFEKLGGELDHERFFIPSIVEVKKVAQKSAGSPD